MCNRSYLLLLRTSELSVSSYLINSCPVSDFVHIWIKYPILYRQWNFKIVCTHNGWTSASHWWASDPISGDKRVMRCSHDIALQDHFVCILIPGGWSHSSSRSSQQRLGGCRTKGYYDLFPYGLSTVLTSCLPYDLSANHSKTTEIDEKF